MSRFRRDVVLIMVLLAVISSTSARKKHFKGRNSRPNIVVIMADDLGWNDVGYNNPMIKTPTINALSRGGITLDYHYTLPVCSPSRSSFMTGRYPRHENFYTSEDFGVDTNEVFLSEKLRDLGYSTNAIGKWHLGFSRKEYLPRNRGFDYFFGFLGGGQSYFNHTTRGFSQCGDLTREPVLDFYRNEQVVRNQTGVYSTFVFTREAENVIHQHNRSKPLFLYLAYQEAHAPMEVPKEYLKKYMHINNRNRRTFMAKTTLLDEGVLNVTRALKKKKLWDNTLLLFLSDNGAHHTTGSNWPLRGYKATLFEGGIRNVAFLQGGVLPKGGFNSRTIVHISDWLPTFVGLADKRGVKTEKFDGVDVWKSIISNEPSPRKFLIYKTHGKLAIRTRNWKLLVKQKEVPHIVPAEMKRYVKNSLKTGKKAALVPVPVLLYNLKNDPNEVTNLACWQKKVVSNLISIMKKYFKTNFFSTLGRPCNKKASDWAEQHSVWGPYVQQGTPGLNTGELKTRKDKRRHEKEKRRLLARLNTTKLLSYCKKNNSRYHKT